MRRAAPTPSNGPGLRRAPVIALSGLLLGLAVVGAVAGERVLDQPGSVAPATALVFLALVAIAEQLRIDFRYRDGTDSINVVEAVVAPLLLTVPIAPAVAIVAAGHGIANAMRRNRPLKGSFNVAQWAAAAAVGALVLRSIAGGEPSAGDLPALALAMAVLAAANQSFFVAVIAVSSGRSPRAVLRDLAPVIVPGWVFGWLVSMAFGLVFALAQLGAPGGTLLFVVPLAVLHLASRGLVRGRLERDRLEGAQHAIAALRAPVDYREAVPAFLTELCQCFDADGAELVVPSVDARAERHAVIRSEAGEYEPVDGSLSEYGEEVVVLSIALPSSGEAGFLTLYGRRGFQGFETVDRTVLELIGREVVAAMEKTALVVRTIADRRKLAELGAVVAWSDDAMIGQTLDGVITMWNGGAERLFGYSQEEVVGKPVTMLVPEHRRAVEWRVLSRAGGGTPVRHHETELVRKDGQYATVSITVSPVLDPAGRPVAISAVARDIGERKEAEALARRLEEESQRRRQALWLNDRIVQELAVAAMAMDLGEDDVARASLDSTLRSARRIVTALLPAGGVDPGDLICSPSAQEDLIP